MRKGLSRRDMLSMAGAAGGLAIAGRFGGALAQGAQRIEQMDAALSNIIATNEPIRQLATGFGGDIGPAEGPLWMAEQRHLLFNDIHTARRMRYTPGQNGATVAMEKTNEANGITRDLQGRILSAEHLTRRVTRYEPDGSVTVIANSFGGKRLLRPNDVGGEIRRLDLFHRSGRSACAGSVGRDGRGRLSRVRRSRHDVACGRRHGRPNGLAFSPDESILYVNDARRRHARAYDLLPNGTLAEQTSRLFADLGGAEPGVPDGMKVDVQGNVYSGGGGGLYIMDKTGKKLGRIVHGQPATTNVAFGGDDWKTLYFTSRSTLFSVNVKIAGVPVPVKKKTA